MNEALQAYGFPENLTQIEKFGSGLINSTWLIQYKKHQYILQKINTSIFRKPEFIAENIKKISDFLKETNPNYLFVSPIKNFSGKDLFVSSNSEYYRLFYFIPNTHTIDVVGSSHQAFQAAAEFGKFTKNLSDFNVFQLNITIQDFHNLSLRFNQFENAIANAEINRKEKSNHAIHFLLNQQHIVQTFEKIKTILNFKLRVTHHDTKISNVLFNTLNECLCVIDLDTVMPGYFFSDVGDMMRTYLPTANEEETDFTKIIIRDEYFKAIASGYLSELKNELTTDELNYFYYAGEFMIYMQAIRFLTDYLNNDIYYGSKYPHHNLNRACNQIDLLKKYQEKKKQYVSYIKTISSN